MKYAKIVDCNSSVGKLLLRLYCVSDQIGQWLSVSFGMWTIETAIKVSPYFPGVLGITFLSQCFACSEAT